MRPYFRPKPHWLWDDRTLSSKMLTRFQFFLSWSSLIASYFLRTLCKREAVTGEERKLTTFPLLNRVPYPRKSVLSCAKLNIKEGCWKEGWSEVFQLMGSGLDLHQHFLCKLWRSGLWPRTSGVEVGVWGIGVGMEGCLALCLGRFRAQWVGFLPSWTTQNALIFLCKGASTTAVSKTPIFPPLTRKFPLFVRCVALKRGVLE